MRIFAVYYLSGPQRADPNKPNKMRVYQTQTLDPKPIELKFNALEFQKLHGYPRTLEGVGKPGKEEEIEITVKIVIRDSPGHLQPPEIYIEGIPAENSRNNGIGGIINPFTGGITLNATPNMEKNNFQVYQPQIQIIKNTIARWKEQAGHNVYVHLSTLLPRENKENLKTFHYESFDLDYMATAVEKKEKGHDTHHPGDFENNLHLVMPRRNWEKITEQTLLKDLDDAMLYRINLRQWPKGTPKDETPEYAKTLNYYHKEILQKIGRGEKLTESIFETEERVLKERNCYTPLRNPEKDEDALLRYKQFEEITRKTRETYIKEVGEMFYPKKPK